MRALLVAAGAILLMSHAPAIAQPSDYPPTPVAPCDSNAINSPDAVARPSVPPARGASQSAQTTSIAITNDGGQIRYFVMAEEVTVNQLGVRLVEVWRQNSPGVADEDCFSGGPRLCRIRVRAGNNVAYRDVLRALNQLQRMGFTLVGFATTPDPAADIRTDLLPPRQYIVPIQLQGRHATNVSIRETPVHAIVVNLANSSGSTAVSLAQLDAVVLQQATANNPALAPAEIRDSAAICVRADQSTAFRNVIEVMQTLRSAGYARVKLYPDLAHE